MMDSLTKRVRQNKANFRPDRVGQGPAQLPVPAVEAIVRNKANWARTRKKSGGTPNLRRADRAKQSQFARRTGKRRRWPGRGQTKPISTRQIDPMDPESAAVRRSQPEVPCLLCGVEFSVPWGYDLWDASWLPSSGRKEVLCFLAGPGKGWIHAFTWTIDWQQPPERGRPLRPWQR